MTYLLIKNLLKYQENIKKISIVAVIKITQGVNIDDLSAGNSPTIHARVPFTPNPLRVPRELFLLLTAFFSIKKPTTLFL